MIFLRLECDLRGLAHGSKYDTYRNLACIRVDDHTEYNDVRHVT